MIYPIIWLVTLIVACFCIILRCYYSSPQKQWQNVLRRVLGYGATAAVISLLVILLKYIEHIRAPPV